MLKISLENIPKSIVSNMSYILYYSFLFYIFILFSFLALFAYEIIEPMTDYQLFVTPILLAVPVGIIIALNSVPIEKKIIKRNIFVAGLIQVLKENKSMSFKNIFENYSYFLFQNKKVKLWNHQWASYIEALIALGVIGLKNHKSLKGKCKHFDYKEFNKKFFDAELYLKDKNVNLDELIKKLDNFIL